MDSPDLITSAYNEQWGQVRSYSNRLGSSSAHEGTNGAKWLVAQMPEIVNVIPDADGDPNHGTLAVMRGATNVTWFKYNPGTGAYDPLFFSRDSLTLLGDEFVHALSNGTQTTFFDLSPGSAGLRGKFKAQRDRYRHVSLPTYDANDRIVKFTQDEPSSSSSSGSSGSGSSTSSVVTIEYAYVLTGENAGRIASATQKRDATSLRRAQYSYYPSAVSGGTVGDLKTVRLQQFSGNGWENLGTTYYRYYKAGEANGFEHGLKFVIAPGTYARMVKTGIQPESASDASLAIYADRYFEYDNSQRVKREKLSGGTYTSDFAYTPSPNPLTLGDYNNWRMKTVETLPDGTQNIVYTNFAGQVMLKVFKAGTSEWYEYYKYDSGGRCINHASSAAVSSYSEASATLVTLKTSTGLITVYDYYGLADPAPGLLKAEKVKAGSSGSETKIRELEYVFRTNADGETITPISKETRYQSSAGGGSVLSAINYAYTWYGDTLQPQQITRTSPAIAASQNGDNVAYVRDEIFSSYGLQTWSRDELGFITRRAYDPTTSALSQEIRDVNVALTPDAPTGWVTPTGGGLHLITDYSVDGLGRRIQELGPVHALDLAGVSTNVRRATWIVYKDVQHQQYEGFGYQTVSSGAFTLINPVSVRFWNGTDQVTDEIKAVRLNASGKLIAADTFPQTTWVRWQHRVYAPGNLLQTERVYHLIPAAGSGVPTTNYGQSQYGYDSVKRVVRVQTPGGTIMRSVYHPMGWILEEWVGTDDTGATNSNPAGAGGSNNMVKLRSFIYDGGVAKGNGNRTRQTEHVNATITRITDYTYDFRNRLTVINGEIDLYAVREYDNQDRVVKEENWNTYQPSGSSSSGSGGQGNLVKRSEFSYDLLGRLYRSTQYAVDPTTGVVGNSLKTNFWYDGRGGLWKRQNPGAETYIRTFYDGVGRATMGYFAYFDASLNGEIILEQREYSYDAASNGIQQITRRRFHDATGVGLLTTPSGTQPKARVSYSAFWHDALGREKAKAEYGTNHADSWTRPATIPARSDSILVESSNYNIRGELDLITDAAGVVTRQVFDDADRLAKSVNDYSLSPGHLNQESQFTYTLDNQIATSVRKNSTTGDQTTTYTYGTTLADSNVASNLLLRALATPDSTGPSDRIEVKYNRLGEIIEKKDQNQSVHVLEYDKLGRLIHDRVTILGSGVDGAARRISYAYEVRNLLTGVTTYDNATVGTGTVLNDVRLDYNSFCQLVREYQSHSGAVNTSTTPKVQYTYANGSANTVRVLTMVYPDGRVLTYDYGTTGGIHDKVGRVQKLSIGAVVLATYSYVGMQRRVRVEYNEPGIELTYIKQGAEPVGDGGDQYTGWDRFGRVIDQRWLKTSTAATLERVQYGFSRSSSRKFRDNFVAASGQDEYYTYDLLSQLTNMDRGNLNAGRTGISGTPAREEDFTFDPWGNWNQFAVKVDGATTLNQSRTHTVANEISAIDSSTLYISHDANGNTIKAPKVTDWLSALTLVFDAWNRIVAIKEGATTLGSYTYDGSSRRQQKTVGGTARHYYYSQEWQVVEERTGSSTTSERQFIWGLRYPDDLILRDRGAERLYTLHDYFSVTAVATTAGSVSERYGYDSFGLSRVMDSAFAARASSLYDWEIRFDSYRWDSESGLYQVRDRFLHPRTGRWLSRDPIGERGGVNLYAYATNNPINFVDPYGHDITDWNWVEPAANFAAGFADSLTMGATSWLRGKLDIDAVDYSSGLYFVGEATEFAVETTITFGGGALRRVARQHAGKAARYLLEGNAREGFRRALGRGSGAVRGGIIHHWNPIREGRFPLPFRRAARSHFNLTWIRDGLFLTAAQQHRLHHWWIKLLDTADIIRTFTSPIRFIGNLIIQHINWLGAEQNRLGKCPPAPDLEIDLEFEATVEAENIAYTDIPEEKG